MTAAKSFKQEIEAALKDVRPPVGTPYDEARRQLQEAAEAIEQSLPVSEGDIQIRVERGHAVNLGQQYRVMLRIPKQDYGETFFRAYIPDDGYPVTLDFFEDDTPQCFDATDLQVKIVEFLRDPKIQRKLGELVEIAKS